MTRILRCGYDQRCTKSGLDTGYMTENCRDLRIWFLLDCVRSFSFMAVSGMLMDAKLSKVPSSNSQFWIDKFDANKKRDRRNIDLLKANGWRVMIVWGCAIKGKNELEIANLASQCGKWLNSDEEFREIGNDS